MGIFDFFKRNKPKVNLLSEGLEALAMVSDEMFTSASKDLLKNFDDYITAAETESESLSIELDDNLDQQEKITFVLKGLSKPNSWQERHYLLKLDRLKLHGKNIKVRIEIYSQNIKVYLNLMSKVQDIKAMRLNGLDEKKIEHIWLEFKTSVEDYRSKLTTEETGYGSEVLTTVALEDRLEELKREVFRGENHNFVPRFGEPVIKAKEIRPKKLVFREPAPRIPPVKEGCNTDQNLICE